MQDFIQVGQPHSELMTNIGFIILLVFIGGIALLSIVAGVMTWIVRAVDWEEGRKTTMILANSVLVMSVIAFIFYQCNIVEDYRGTFDVVQSETHKNADTLKTEQRVALKDSKGRKQVFEVPSSQKFRKGGKAVVTVQAKKGERPTLEQVKKNGHYVLFNGGILNKGEFIIDAFEPKP